MAKFKHIPTAKLKEILDDPYQRSNIGTDYGPYIEEIRAIYNERVTREALKTIDRELKELEEYEKSLQEVA